MLEYRTMQGINSSTHPMRDLIIDQVRSWYESSATIKGYPLEHRRFGFYAQSLSSVTQGIVQIKSLSSSDVNEFLADLAVYYGSVPVLIIIQNKEQDIAISPSLIRMGCSPSFSDVHLVHTDPAPIPQPVPGIRFESVGPANLLDFTITKLKALTNHEDEPNTDHIEKEMSLRQADLANGGRFFLARARRGLPVGIIGWYEGDDRLIFTIGTRLPFRRRGIAKGLLTLITADAYKQGCRSVVLRCEPTYIPAQLYQPVGFKDQVYWRQFYTFSPELLEPLAR